MTTQNRLICVFLLIVFAFVAIACSPLKGTAQSEGLPSWVNNPSEQFSNDRYLMAVGSAPTRQGAKNNAQSNLAKIFVSKVEVDEKYVQEYEETSSSGEGTQTRARTNIVTRSEVESNQKMRNVQIKEVYQAESGTFYALAMMNRSKTSQLYTEEINRNNEAIKSLRKKANNTDSKLERLIYMKQALTNARMNEMLKNQRAILTGQTTQGEGTAVAEIVQNYRQAKQECTVSISGKDIPRDIQSAIRRKLQNEGFTISKGSEEPVVKMNVNLTMRPLDMGRENVEFMEWTFQVEAQNRETGKWFSTFAEEGRNGSISKQRARRLARKKVMETIDKGFSDFINKELLSVQ